MADTITYLTTTRFGAGAVELLPQELAELGIRKPLLVTDPGIARLPLLDRVRRMLPAEHALFAETPGNPDRGGGRRRPSTAYRARAPATGWSRSAAARPWTWPRRWPCAPPMPGSWPNMR